tara:strand:+ start:607 stop:1563 length:957 start_codon:yes stop_codon:yes gene_type:complete
MAYIGVTPSNVFGQGTKDSFNGDGSTTAFTLSRSVLLATDIEVFVGNVRQEPNVAYTVSGTTLTFTGTPASGTGNIYVVHQSANIGTLVPPTGLASTPTSITASGNATIGGTLGVTGAATLSSTLAVTGTSTLTGTVTANGDMVLGGTTPTLTIGDAGTEDAKIVFDGNAQDFHIGLDDSADDLIIGKGSTLGTTPVISIDENLVSTFGGAAVGATLTDTTNTGNITLDFNAYQNFVLTFTGNVTLDNPTTESTGQSGFIVIIQDGTGSRTLSLGTDFETAGSAGITLSTTASARDIIPYAVSASGSIILGAVQKAFG